MLFYWKDAGLPIKGIFLLGAFLSILASLECDKNDLGTASCVPFETGMGRGSSIALDSFSRPQISYADDDNLSIKYAYWDGDTWVKETAYEHVKPENFDKFHSSENLGLKTYLNLGQNDKQLIHFCDQKEDKLKYLVKNGSWLAQTIEQVTGCSASIDADSQGNPRMAYADEDSNELVYSILSPTPATTVVKGLLPDASYPFLNLFIDAEDDAHIGIVEVQTDGNGLEEKTFFRIFQNGVTWQEESSSIQYDLISLALDSNDVFKGLFFNRDGLSYYYGEFLAGDWSFENITIPQSIVSGYFSLDDLELASDDQPWFYGKVRKKRITKGGTSESLYDILVVHKNGGEWQTNILEVNSWGKPAEPSMSIDSSGNLHLSYCSKTFIRHSEFDCEARAVLYYAIWDGNDWNIEKVDE